MTLIFAHRGVTDQAPANTLTAFADALSLGIDGIETDVQQTQDGQLVIFHDARLEYQTNGYGPVSAHTLAYLQSLVIRDHTRRGKMMTVDELLTFLKQQDFRGLLNLELKTRQKIMPQLEARLAAKLLSGSWPFTVVISSFSSKRLQRFHKLAPQIDTALLFRFTSWQARWLSRRGIITAWHPKTWWWQRHQQPTKTPVRVWTVNDRSTLTACFEQQVNGVITDRARLAKQLRQRQTDH